MNMNIYSFIKLICLLKCTIHGSLSVSAMSSKIITFDAPGFV